MAWWRTYEAKKNLRSRRAIRVPRIFMKIGERFSDGFASAQSETFLAF